MALNFNSIASKVQMYDIVIDGHKWTFDEPTTQKVIDILNGFASGSSVKPSTTLHIEEPKGSRPIIGKKIWQEDFLTVVDDGGAFRVYITCPVKGEKGEKIRYALKASAKAYGAEWTGDLSKNIVHWTFADKSQAEHFIQSRRDWAEKHPKQ